MVGQEYQGQLLQELATLAGQRKKCPQKLQHRPPDAHPKTMCCCCRLRPSSLFMNPVMVFACLLPDILSLLFIVSALRMPHCVHHVRTQL